MTVTEVGAGQTERVEFFYPDREGKTRIIVSLSDVRAADDMVITYDFARDGYSIRMATVHGWTVDDAECDPKLVEVAFVPAWVNYDCSCLACK